VQFLHGATIFSTIDLIRAYQQVPVKEENIPKTVIITSFELYEFPFMTFGLRHVTQTLWMKSFEDSTSYVYLDDVKNRKRTS